MIRTFRLVAPKTLAGRLFLLALSALLLTTLAACGGAEPAATAPTPTEAAAVVAETAVVAPTPTTPFKNISDIAATGVATTPTPAGLRPQYGGTINYANSTVAVNVDPWHLLANGTAGGANYLWHNSPIQMKFPLDLSKGVEYEPGLATQWSTSADGSKWTLKLRQGVTFHDGELFNADDVVATMKRVLDPQVFIQARQVPVKKIFVDVRKVDDYTVVYDTGDSPNASAFVFLSSHHMAIVPEHIIRGVDPTSTDVNKRWKFMGPDPIKNTGTLGIGTGAFKMVKWTPEVELIGERNPNYWKFDEFGGRLPYVDRHVMSAVPDGTRRLAFFAAGQSEYTNGIAAGMHPDKAKILCSTTKDKDCYISQFPHGSFPVIVNPNSTPVFKDPKVMAATFYAPDMDTILVKAYGGRQGFMWMDRGRFPETALSVKEQYTVLPWSDPARRSEFKQKAKDLMIEAGYTNGIDLPFPAFANSCFDSFLNHATLELDAWHQMGLRVPLECRAGILINDELKANRWSMTVLGHNISTLDPGHMPQEWAILDSGAIASAPWRWEGQAVLDDMYQKTVRTADNTLRNERYKEMERYLANPAFTMFSSGFTTVFMSIHGCVHNFRPGGTWESWAFSHEKTWLSGDCRK